MNSTNWQYHEATSLRLSLRHGKSGQGTQKSIRSLRYQSKSVSTVDENSPSNVSRWVKESRDPSAEAVFEIKEPLEKLEPAAAKEFVMRYLYDSGEGEES